MAGHPYGIILFPAPGTFFRVTRTRHVGRTTTPVPSNQVQLCGHRIATWKRILFHVEGKSFACAAIRAVVKSARRTWAECSSKYCHTETGCVTLTRFRAKMRQE